jgi:hypothetical protein
MDRRLTGIGVLVLALLAAAILPVLGGRRISGIAERAQIPVLGDCVLATLPPWTSGGSASDPQALADRPTGRLASCAEPGASRVIGRQDAVRLTDRLSRGAYLEQIGALCSDAVMATSQRLQGGPYTWQSGNKRIGYQASLLLAGEVATPTPAAMTAGERWTVCYSTTFSGTAELPTAIDGNHPGAELGVCYRDKIAADRSAEIPAEYDGSAGRSQELTGCAQPHTRQSVGYASTGAGGLTVADFLAACRGYLVRVTGRSDPTAGGQLRIDADSGDRQALGYGEGQCGVRVSDPSRTLSGSLIGIGDGPLPWT